MPPTMAPTEGPEDFELDEPAVDPEASVGLGELPPLLKSPVAI